MADVARANATAGAPPLDAVLFDAGGTLVRLDFEWMAGALGELGVRADVPSLRRAEISGRRAYDHARGARAGGRPAPGEVDAYFGGMLRAAGCDDAQVAAALERFRARHVACGLWTRPAEGAREAIARHAAQGLALAVISNSDGRAEQHLEDCGVRAGLAFVIDSHLVGFEKPDPAIFRVALDRLGVPGSRALFVGDIRVVDEQGAAAAGTRFVLIDPFGDYAPPGTPAIGEIAALPDWTAEHFTTPARRAGAHSVSSERPSAP